MVYSDSDLQSLIYRLEHQLRGVSEGTSSDKLRFSEYRIAVIAYEAIRAEIDRRNRVASFRVPPLNLPWPLKAKLSDKEAEELK